MTRQEIDAIADVFNAMYREPSGFDNPYNEGWVNCWLCTRDKMADMLQNGLWRFDRNAFEKATTTQEEDA